MSHDHPPYLQHHFDTAEQQFDAGKLGIWLFLATEVLLFGGLFCAYAIYRGNHPEIFVYAHQFLDKVWGGINTIVLLCSSLTMAWAVRAAQLGQRRLLALLLSLTLLGGFGFMGIKFVEYKQKWEHGLLPGTHFAPHDEVEHEPKPHPDAVSVASASAQPAPDAHASAAPASSGKEPPEHGANPSSGTPATAVSGPMIKPSAAGPSGTVRLDAAGHRPNGHGKRPSNTQIFFGIYFLMTGLHGIHVLIGMGAIAWILFRSVRGDFGPDYFTPVDFVGLYWHLVDLIWIFLFPLLYLIA